MVEMEAGADMQPLLDKRKGKWLYVGGARARGSPKEIGGSQKSGEGNLINESRTVGQTVIGPRLRAHHKQLRCSWVRQSTNTPCSEIPSQR
ncbi:hypothetical protein GBA52_015235 [Prunus armeniaca]|nr:hypothetical protein GBA52_015235 [Prunus armeniaca]